MIHTACFSVQAYQCYSVVVLFLKIRMSWQVADGSWAVEGNGFPTGSQL